MEKLKIISIEGNIGSGKSTVVNSLKHYYLNDQIYFLDEPVDEWNKIKDKNDKTILEKFYENQYLYSFSFQIMAYISRLSMLKKAIKYCEENNIYLIICERSLQTDKNVFCKMLYDNNKIDEINYQIYLRWFDEFTNDFPDISYIYINTMPDIAYQRVIKRNRKGETISLDYLRICSDYHNNWFKKEKHFDINGNGNYETTFNNVNDILKILR